MSSLYGVSAYQQTNQTWSKTTKKNEEVTKSTDKSSGTTSKSDKEVKISTWSPIDTSSSLVPTSKDGVGLAIGDVQLSDEAKEYYNKLKAKFGNMEFIAVSQDMKSQVQANAASYGNASKQVVLIDDAKLELMATDESYREKYEAIIAMSQLQLTNAKNSLASSGASVTNFGMSVNSDGSTSYFATVEKSSDTQTKKLQKKQAEKKAAKAKEKKKAEKKEQEEKLEKTRQEKKEKEEKLEKAHEEKKEKEEKLEKAHEEKKEKAEQLEKTRPEQPEKINDDAEDKVDNSHEKEYVEIKANSMEELIDRVSRFAYEDSSKAVMTEEEKSLGQNFDFRG